MLKAEISGEEIPTKGIPQDGILSFVESTPLCESKIRNESIALSPLLSNVVLNELDWWLSSQWLDHPTRHNYAQNCHKIRA